MPPQLSEPLQRTIDAMFRDLWKPPAMAVALCTPAGLGWRACLGERQVGSAATIDEKTVFALASGTKTMAVATIAQLCDSGALGWDAHIADIDPDFDAGDANVTAALTLRDLACHRTGWTSSEGRHRAAATSRADLVRRIRYHGFRHAFREKFAYCTDGFSVLGRVVDVIAKEPWEQFAQANLLRPLGMHNTFMTVEQARASGNFATPHLLIPDGNHAAIPWQYEDGVATPAGGANSCLADLARWLGAWLDPTADATPWSAQQRRIMLEPQIANSGCFADAEFSCAIPLGENGLTKKAYALGWYCHRYRGERIYHHTGSIRGFRSLIALLPERKLGFVALVNADAVFLPRAIFQAVLDDLQGSDPTTWTDRFFQQETSLREPDMRRYVRHAPRSLEALAGLPGVYRDDGRFGSVRIATDHEGFTFHAGPLRYRLLPLDANALECGEDCGPLFINQGRVHLQRDAGGAVTGFEFQGALFRRA